MRPGRTPPPTPPAHTPAPAPSSGAAASPAPTQSADESNSGFSFGSSSSTGQSAAGAGFSYGNQYAGSAYGGASAGGAYGGASAGGAYGGASAGGAYGGASAGGGSVAAANPTANRIDNELTTGGSRPTGTINQKVREAKDETTSRTVQTGKLMLDTDMEDDNDNELSVRSFYNPNNDEMEISAMQRQGGRNSSLPYTTDALIAQAVEISSAYSQRTELPGIITQDSIDNLQAAQVINQIFEQYRAHNALSADGSLTLEMNRQQPDSQSENLARILEQTDNGRVTARFIKDFNALFGASNVVEAARITMEGGGRVQHGDLAGLYRPSVQFQVAEPD